MAKNLLVHQAPQTNSTEQQQSGHQPHLPIMARIAASFSLLVLLFAFLATCLQGATIAAATYPDLLDASITQLQAGLERGDYTSVDLVKAYLARIEEVNINGPGLRAIIETSPVAIDQAQKLDDERAQGNTRGSLRGIPIVVKDNVATDAKLSMNTTAGSYTLLNSIVPGDSPSIRALRKAGAVILGKANMSVWAQARGLDNQTQGYSPRGGFGTSAYWPAGNPCSSSSGSAVAVAAGLAAASVGSQTSGSIICPASYNNIVGIKPTVGLISRSGVIPISFTQDSAGSFGKTVKDVAMLFDCYGAPREG